MAAVGQEEKAESEEEEAERSMLLQESTSPDLRLGGARVPELAVQ